MVAVWQDFAYRAPPGKDYLWPGTNPDSFADRCVVGEDPLCYANTVAGIATYVPREALANLRKRYQIRQVAGGTLPTGSQVVPVLVDYTIGYSANGTRETITPL